MKTGDRVWLSGDSGTMWIDQYRVCVDSGATVIETPSAKTKKVMVCIDRIDHDSMVTSYVKRTACRKITEKGDNDND